MTDPREPPKGERAPPPPPAGKNTLGKALEALQAAGRPVFEGRWYANEKIDLDAATFRRCRFDNCRLLTTVGDIDLDGCVIGPDCKVMFGGSAGRVLQFLNYRGSYDSLSPLFAAQYDGTAITIPRTDPKAPTMKNWVSDDDIPF